MLGYGLNMIRFWFGAVAVGVFAFRFFYTTELATWQDTSLVGVLFWSIKKIIE